MYPIEKYRYFTNGNKVIAVSTYAGKTVRGVAICDKEDTFDFEKGKQLAAARCAVKVAEKRLNRAYNKRKEAENKMLAAESHVGKMAAYCFDALSELEDAREVEEDILKSL